MRTLPSRTSPRSPDERGFSLMEAIVGTVIATIAVTGLAYSFGTGRALIHRYEVGRAALGAAQARMEWLSTLPLASLSDSSVAFVYRGATLGSEAWTVTPFDDPLTVANHDMDQVSVTVTWGSGANQQSIAMTRLFPLP
jgi:Tfp pilus assembly protein PilV